MTARLLDEIDETGNAVGIVRFGRLVAILAPFDGGEAIGLSELPAEPSIDEFELTDRDRDIFALIAADPRGGWGPNQKPADRSMVEVMASLTRLELAGLIEGELGRFRLTRLGSSVRRS